MKNLIFFIAILLAVHASLFLSDAAFTMDGKKKKPKKHDDEQGHSLQASKGPLKKRKITKIHPIDGPLKKRADRGDLEDTLEEIKRVVSAAEQPPVVVDTSHAITSTLANELYPSEARKGVADTTSATDEFHPASAEGSSEEARKIAAAATSATAISDLGLDEIIDDNEFINSVLENVEKEIQTRSISIRKVCVEYSGHVKQSWEDQQQGGDKGFSLVTCRNFIKNGKPNRSNADQLRMWLEYSIANRVYVTLVLEDVKEDMTRRSILSPLVCRECIELVKKNQQHEGDAIGMNTCIKFIAIGNPLSMRDPESYAEQLNMWLDHSKREFVLTEKAQQDLVKRVQAEINRKKTNLLKFLEKHSALKRAGKVVDRYRCICKFMNMDKNLPRESAKEIADILQSCLAHSKKLP